MDVLHLTLRQLQIFVAVAGTGSTTAAGSEVALSQSATSAALNELERLLSVRLFDRAGKRLLLNDNGRALLPRAQALLDAAHGIEHMARAPSARMQSLRIGASTTIGNHVVPKLLEGFVSVEARDAQQWRSSVSIANTAGICARVAAFELDIGLIEGPSHEPALELHPWLRDEMVVVGAPAAGRRRAPAPRLAVKDLRDQVWLLREPGSGTREAVDEALLPHLRSYRRSIELASSEAIRRAASLGLGIACMSRLVAQDALAAGTLRELPTTLPKIVRQCYWVVHRQKQLTPTLQAFIGELSRTGLTVT